MFWENLDITNGDIFDLMILHMLEKSEKEVDEIYEVYTKYIKNKDEFNIRYYSNKLNALQNIIYKLGLIGVVEDWTIDYRLGLINGTAVKLTNDEIERKIEQYINKYEYDFSFKNINLIKYKFVQEILNKNDDAFKKYINVLCTWYNENILYSNRRGIEQIDKLITSMPSEVDCTEEYNKIINSYFQPQDYNLLLKYIEKEDGFLEAIKILYNDDNKIESLRIDSIRATVDRLLVTNRLNPILDLLSGLINLIQNKGDDIHAEEFENSLSIISKNKESDKIYEEILKVFKDMQVETKNKLNQKLFKYFNNEKDFILNYKILKTEDTANYVIKLEKDKLLNIERGVINGFGKNE